MTATSASAAASSSAATRRSEVGSMPMREARVIALAGVFQACRMVHELATSGRTESASAEASLASIFRIDAEGTADVFGGISDLRLGRVILSVQLGDGTRNRI